MAENIRWGIIGPGRIAGNVARDFPLTRGAELVAVASRSLERAQAFATAVSYTHLTLPTIYSV